jgi:hypothetical protein
MARFDTRVPYHSQDVKDPQPYEAFSGIGGHLSYSSDRGASRPPAAESGGTCYRLPLQISLRRDDTLSGSDGRSCTQVPSSVAAAEETLYRDATRGGLA